MHTFHVIEPAYKDHLCIRTTFCWSVGLSLNATFSVVVFSDNFIQVVITISQGRAPSCKYAFIHVQIKSIMKANDKITSDADPNFYMK